MDQWAKSTKKKDSSKGAWWGHQQTSIPCRRSASKSNTSADLLKSEVYTVCYEKQCNTKNQPSEPTASEVQCMCKHGNEDISASFR